jgi:hypothetical protein
MKKCRALFTITFASIFLAFTTQTFATSCPITNFVEIEKEVTKTLAKAAEKESSMNVCLGGFILSCNGKNYNIFDTKTIYQSGLTSEFDILIDKIQTEINEIKKSSKKH